MLTIIPAEDAPRIAALEISALTAAGTVPAALFQDAHVSESPTPIHDLNGDVLFHRLSIRGQGAGAYADIAASPVFGELLLRVSHGFPWDEKSLLEAASTAARKRKRSLRFDSARFVAYSYPKVAVQFLSGNEEVLMIELGSWESVPPRPQRKRNEPPGNFERWSLIEEYPPYRPERGAKRIEEKLEKWKEFEARDLDALRISPERFRTESLGLRVDTRRVAYSLRDGDHVPCYELRAQETNVWCVAASVQMVLDFYRYNYDQTRIAADLGLGTLANPNGLSYSHVNDVVTVLEAITSNALDADIITGPSWTNFRDEIRANRPLISFIPGHSRSVAGYTSTRFGSFYLFRGLLVYDPWPPGTGVITEWENFDAMTYQFLYPSHVKLT
jgi:hypothetical protein